MQSAEAPSATSRTPSVEVTSKKLLKAKKTKSRSGCRNCKDRRLKCDETRPACLHCVRRGRVCPGYKQNLRWSTKYEKFLGEELNADPNNAQDDTQRLVPAATIVPDTSQSFLIPDLSRVSSGEPDAAEPLAARIAPDRNQIESDQAVPSKQLPSATLSDITPLRNFESDGSLDPIFHTDTELDWLLNNGTEVDGLFGTDLDGFSNNATLAEPRRKPVTSSLDFSRGLYQTGNISYAPVDVSMLLIEYWFTNVCPMWSAYDSASNPNRQIALTTWQHSEPVILSLQSMSAAYLADSLPHLKPQLAKISGQAIEAVQKHLKQHFETKQDPTAALPVDTLFAVFAMGTSMCWTVTRELGTSLLSIARRLVSSYERQSERLSHSDQKYLSHFRNALIYWEMLHNVVSPDGHQDALAGTSTNKRQRLIETASNNSSPPHSVGPTRKDFQSLERESTCDLHPWTGISRHIQEQFSLVLALCRTHQQRSRNNGLQMAAQLYDSIRDIELAHELESELLTFDPGVTDGFGSLDDSSLDTGDSTTPISHLVDVAEAYRLASLLQLYQVFPDLRIKTALLTFSRQLTTISFIDQSQTSCREEGILALTFQLLELLRRIPIESGTRCIQPILYLIAATGLFFDKPVSQPAMRKPSQSLDDFDEIFALVNTEHLILDQQQSLEDVPISRLAPQHQVSYEPDPGETSGISLTQCTIRVARSRQFIMDRFRMMQACLPPRPIKIALNLAKAIWAEYDDSPALLARRHWTDVMLSKSLWTLFG
ncbi:hypothetical protein K431DRAFT_323668 [Polychaeton citri CBS 116435]|uniref:Zn(2)-C6 fungal-type domain-containing protein n=1 Tax=Polychaeton citri CBS 116435 TaxID=1314669 RepID=A0A9P4Q1H6_9PEZI|nr:hypothetical protein K431DRAFT_323668 [Polychaeton citri CBS 116435]